MSDQDHFQPGFLRLLLRGAAGLGLVFVLGCSLAATERGGPAPSEKKVMVPWVQDGQYKVQTVSLTTMDNLTDLDGRSALFMLSPSIVNQRLMGFRPRVRAFQDANGVHVPTDELSLHLLTLYAHLEKLRDLDRWVGLGDLLPEPRVVGVEVRIPQKKKNFLGNNALYSPQLDALLFVPYRGDDLPLTVNAGVIAHEHFHALFNYLVLKSTKKVLKTEEAGSLHLNEENQMRQVFQDLPGVQGKVTPPGRTNDWELYHVNLLRAMNEGLADVWGWIYSGDTIFVRRSLPSLKSARDLETNVTRLQSLRHFRESTSLASLSGAEVETAYVLANQYASAIRAVFLPYLNQNKMERSELARRVVQVLPALAKRVNSLNRETWLQPSLLIELFVETLGPKEQSLCEPLMRLIPDVQTREIQDRCQTTREI